MLALSMIIKDDTEVDLLDRCLGSIAPFVDGIFITSTNIPNKEIKLLCKKYDAIHSHFKWTKSFEEARNFAMEQIPEEYEFMVWCDTDDIWINAEKLPDMTKIMEKQGLTAVVLDYNYEIAENGKVNVVHPRERIVRKDMYKWKGHLHETLIPIGYADAGYYKDIKVNHYPTEENKQAGFVRNLEILEETYKNEGDEHDPRTEFYLARTLLTCIN